MEREDDKRIGLMHDHRWHTVSTRAALQSAHDRMRWDVSVSRILAVDVCDVCSEHQRPPIQECTTPGCSEHSICQRPHR